ncbi:MAG: alpha/beta hydrolase [Rhodobacteraceae bacterium]|nr:alpha/beta hydrolase [Paracoccaceae bacterium]
MIHRFGTGPRRVLALHCAQGNGAMLAGIALPDTTLIAPDLQGHGTEPLWDGRGDYHGNTTRDAIGLAEKEGQVDLIGHSLGATIALRMALERTELVRSLVLIEPVLFAAARASAPAVYAAHVADFAPTAKALQAGDMMAAAAAFHAIWSDGDFTALPEKVQRALAARMPIIPATGPVFHDDSAGMLTYMRLEALGIPVLLVEGERSPPVMAAIQAELQRRLPQVTRTIIATAGHMSPLTHAPQVRDAIADFYGTSSMM